MATTVCLCCSAQDSSANVALRTDADVERVRSEMLQCMRTSTTFRAPPQCACQLITVYEPVCEGAAAPAAQRGAPALGLTTAHRTGFSNTDEAFIAVHVRHRPRLSAYQGVASFCADTSHVGCNRTLEFLYT